AWTVRIVGTSDIADHASGGPGAAPQDIEGPPATRPAPRSPERAGYARRVRSPGTLVRLPVLVVVALVVGACSQGDGRTLDPPIFPPPATTLPTESVPATDPV